ncbi:putative Short-chain dehydrogenase/reductase SDR [Cupriavidus taiwanensis]|uniref:SDR family NAD(P)-dependent oxidoreductase n=1 Tax=Cupriavidus taiwanensis TaxID=164546 RepID=UPI000E137463|nr:SDR family NAD(P)-dependent oxidoreductase [Cupriavidus taiwanensis]SOY97316.1 putative Short-chain dehydrogenase/reductase SDR [Cupriavidus taiwanensis]SOZ00040.1 putative Short-chain dehydrogenase/reductase SDR [Cupriavidus taiwanensis]
MPDTSLRRTGLLAVVTGASSGIGYELARCCVQRGYDLVIAADEPQIEVAARQLRDQGAEVTALLADLSTPDGVEQVCAALGGRRVDVLCANAGRGLGHAFLDQDFAAIQRVVETNVTGTLHLLHRVGQLMRAQHEGRILITGSIAGFVPGTCQAVYNATKAFLDSFSYALRHELRHTGVSVTCLMPGATETDFFERADLLDTRLGQQKKADPAEVARIGFDAMMRGEGEVVPGWQNKLRAAIAMVTPADVLAEQHRRMAEPQHAPGSAPAAPADKPPAP